MVSLVDIAKVKLPPVEIRGENVDINGLTAQHIADVMFEFPEIRMLMTAKEGQDNSALLQGLLSRLPGAVAMIIAAGTGKAGDQPTIKFAETLGVGEQYALLEGIIKATFPRGVKSFLDGVQTALEQSGVHGWVPGMKSPAPSSPVSKQEEASETAGTAHQSS